MVASSRACSALAFAAPIRADVVEQGSGLAEGSGSENPGGGLLDHLPVLRQAVDRQPGQDPLQGGRGLGDLLAAQAAGAVRDDVEHLLGRGQRCGCSLSRGAPDQGAGQVPVHPLLGLSQLGIDLVAPADQLSDGLVGQGQGVR